MGKKKNGPLEDEERINKNPFAACNLQVTDGNAKLLIKNKVES